jgi:hypothetical protein
MPRIEKGFYGIAFMMSLVATVAVQKNTRDSAVAERIEGGSAMESRFELRKE